MDVGCVLICIHDPDEDSNTLATSCHAHMEAVTRLYDYGYVHPSLGDSCVKLHG